MPLHRRISIRICPRYPLRWMRMRRPSRLSSSSRAMSHWWVDSSITRSFELISAHISVIVMSLIIQYICINVKYMYIWIMSTVLYKLSSCLTGTHFILMLLSIGNAYVSLSLSLFAFVQSSYSCFISLTHSTHLFQWWFTLTNILYILLCIRKTFQKSNIIELISQIAHKKNQLKTIYKKLKYKK